MLDRNELAAGAIALALVAAARAQEAGAAAIEVPLTYQADRDFVIELPAETWSPVGPALRLALYGEALFATSLDGTTLCIDTDRDGKTDVRAEGAKAFVTLRAPSARGGEMAYALRLVNSKGWHYASSGCVQGELEGERIRIIDQNNNGLYGEPGKDAMVVGRGKIATFLSRVVAVGEKLFEVEVAADGSSLTARPWGGPTGTLAVRYQTQGKVLSAVVKSDDGQLFFDLAKATAPTRVPAGRYSILSGKLGLGADRVEVRSGRSKPVEIIGQGQAEIVWGGPVSAEFSFERAGGQLRLAPDQVWYFGAAGEEYAAWAPLGESPTFTITDAAGKEVARAYFPGSC